MIARHMAWHAMLHRSCAGDWPVIWDVEPPFGAATGGTVITVWGAHFRERDLVVAVGGLPCEEVTFASEWRVNCTTPSLVVGPPRVAVSITNGDLTETILGDAYMPQGLVPTRH